MKVITTATNIAQAFKNAGRVREIVTVLASHGFPDLLYRMKLERFLPKKSTNPKFQDLPVQERLRRSFEELGPAFVKFGQLLSSRPDLIPQSFVDEFSKLQDDVAKVPYQEIKATIEAELKAPISEIFQTFDTEPMAAASIAQVHAAVLKNGKKVAVKIQRPGIDRVIHNDISILRGLAALLENNVPEIHPFNPVGLVEEFFQVMMFELDFRVEANNMKKIRQNMQSLKQVTIPEVFPTFSSERVLVLEKFEGIRFSDREAIVQAGINPMDIIEAGAEAFLHMVMKDGLFHGDLHAGNLFVLPNRRIGIIDFGIVGRLSRRVQNSIITMFISIMDEDYETLANEYITLCQPAGETDPSVLQKDLMDTISPYVGMSLGEVNAGIILLRSTSIAAKHHLIVPRELMLLFKAIVTIDGLGKKLDPNFDVLTLGNKLAKQVLTNRYSKDRILHDLIILGRDLQDTLEIFPKLLKRFLRVWSHNGFAIETKSKDTRALAEAIQRFTYYFLVSVTAAILVAVGITALSLDVGPSFASVPILPLLTLGSAGFLLLSSLWRLRGLK